MTELEAQAKDYAMSRKLNLSEPTDITHVIGLLENAYIAGAKGVWHDLRKQIYHQRWFQIIIFRLRFYQIKGK